MHMNTFIHQRKNVREKKTENYIIIYISSCHYKPV